MRTSSTRIATPSQLSVAVLDWTQSSTGYGRDNLIYEDQRSLKWTKEVNMGKEGAKEKEGGGGSRQRVSWYVAGEGCSLGSYPGRCAYNSLSLANIPAFLTGLSISAALAPSMLHP